MDGNKPINNLLAELTNIVRLAESAVQANDEAQLELSQQNFSKWQAHWNQTAPDTIGDFAGSEREIIGKQLKSLVATYLMASPKNFQLHLDQMRQNAVKAGQIADDEEDSMLELKNILELVDPNNITLDELLKQVAIHDGVVNFNLNVKIFCHYNPIEVDVYNKDLGYKIEVPDPEIDDLLVDTLNDLLALGANAKNDIKRLIHESYKREGFEEDDFDPPLNITDEESAYESIEKIIAVIQTPLNEKRNLRIHFYTSWEPEHGIFILVEKGQILELTHDGRE